VCGEGLKEKVTKNKSGEKEGKTSGENAVSHLVCSFCTATSC
jgi:hypothetical protein